MCAINGVTGQGVALVTRMNAATAHRGPDGTRVWDGGRVTLGFNRLAIIDLSDRAMQPMQSFDGRYTIVFNGEIYNYRELKQELKSYHFKSESDTEVILAAYAAWGMRALARLNGMFALAIWDSLEEKLIMARDPAGIKPLFYHFDGNRLVFSSELRGVLEAGMPRILDHSALGHYLRLLYVPRGMTLIKGVSQLYPGECLTYQAGQVSSTLFSHGWPDEAPPENYQDAVQSVRARVVHAVERQLVSDRPVGIYVSGGIDSSSILACASTVHPKINTYSVGYDLDDTEEREKFNADADIASRTAAHFGATHHAVALQSSEVADLFGTMISHMSNPIANSTALAQLYLAKMTKPTATVVLSGEGGDELFGGYERYRLALKAEYAGYILPRLPSPYLPGPLKSIHRTGIERYEQLMFQDFESWLPPLGGLPVDQTKALFLDEFAKEPDTVRALLRTDEHHWLVDEALARADHMSMAASVEARVPLIDLEVAALAHVLPRKYLVTIGGLKRVLKDAFKDVLPPEVLKQPKRGWFSPGAKWLRRSDFVALTDEIFKDGYTDASTLFDLAKVRAALVEHREKKAYHLTGLWAVMTVLAWAREYNVTL